MRVVVAVTLVAGLGGCGFKPANGTGNGSGDGGMADAQIDGPVRMAGCSTFSKLFDTCTMAAGGTVVSINGSADYDTNTNSLTINGGPATHPAHVMVGTGEGMIDVWIASSFSLTGKLRVHGGNPFGIAAENGIMLDGVIDLTDAGAGARPDNKCVGQVGLPGQNHSSHGGGGGGEAGDGGGAILLATANTLTLTVNGAVNVGGGGGHPGTDDGGAGM